MQVSTQKGVDVNFTSAELTLSLDDFSKRILQPAVSVLAANIEADALNMANDVYNAVNNIGSAIALSKVLGARKLLNDNLTPMDDNRSVILNTQDNVDLVDSLKGLFQDSAQISKQYKDGAMGRTAGFDFYENTLMQNQTTGTAAAVTGYLTNGATASGATTLVVDTGTTTFKKGDVITIAGVNRVHPETKADTGVLQQFVVTADAGPSATSLAISPAIITSAGGGRQNVTAAPADNAAISKIGGASAIYKPSLAFHKDAFTFATADLIDVSQFGAWGSRQVMDGISMRIARQYDINNDKIPCRIDVLYGYKTLRAQLAARILSN